MPKPTIIDTPFPTVTEVARIYGMSSTERKRIERAAEQFLRDDAAASRPTHRRLTRKPAGRKLASSPILPASWVSV
jgi:hypothetical protein